MARRIKLTTTLNVADLEQRYRRTSEGMERSHWQIIWLLAQGHPAYEVAQMTGYSAYWIGQIARRFNDEGEEGLLNHRKISRPSPHALLATPEQLSQLRAVLDGPAPHGDVWNGRTVAAWLSLRAGRRVTVPPAWTYIPKPERTRHVPRPAPLNAARAAAQAPVQKSP